MTELMKLTARVVMKRSATGAAATTVLSQNFADRQPKAGMIDWQPVATKQGQVRAARRMLRK